MSLTNAAGLELKGAHAFRDIAGLTGLHVASLRTEALIRTELHQGPQGTLSFWFTPLEDLTASPLNNSANNVPFDYTFFSDLFPGRGNDQVRFGASLLMGYPAMVARFASGAVWTKMDHGLAPFVYAEKAVLRAGYWYHFALTWDQPARQLVIYLNGFMAGHNIQADNFETGAAGFYLGNPMMVFRDLRLEPRALDAGAVAARYRGDRPAGNTLPDADWQQMLVPRFLPSLDLPRDAGWQLAYGCSFTKAGDLDGWERQGPGQKYLEGFRMEVTGEGLYLKTPEPVDIESRMYLWSRRNFEGDQWIEFDFRLESPKGLALLVACASGMQREDFIAEHGLPETGGMVTILRNTRNYHWEFMRRVEAMRTDVETQYLAKNPFGHRLHCACVDRLKQNQWYRLRFIKAGNRLHGSLDGQTVFDVVDSSFANNGPVYNFGRIGLRQMYHTALRYRNLEVWQRPTGALVR